MHLQLLALVALLASLGYCEGECDVVDNVATCGEGFHFPLQLENKEIQKLVIHSKALKIIDQDDLKDYTELEEVDFSKSDIEEINPQAFVNNQKLKVIDLSHNENLNKFIDQSEEPLFFSNSVEKLILRKTGITKFPDNAFVEMGNLTVLDVAENKFEDIENALKHEELSLETLIIMKNDNHATLCETTSLKTILLISYDDESKEKKEEYSCVEGEDDKNFEETSTEKTEETTQTPVEAQTEKTDYSDSCKTKAKNELNRNIVCDEETDKIICNLQCPEGTKAESNMSNPYICSFNTGTFTPDIPKCIKVETTEVSDSEVNNKLKNEEPEQKIEEENEPEKRLEDDVEVNKIDVGEREGRIMLPKINDDVVENTLENEQVGESTSSSNLSGSNIVLGIIVVIVVLGAIGMGYKYWKNHRGYQNARTEDIEEGKEMKTLAVKNTTQPLVEQNNQ